MENRFKDRLRTRQSYPSEALKISSLCQAHRRFTVEICTNNAYLKVGISLDADQKVSNLFQEGNTLAEIRPQSLLEILLVQDWNGTAYSNSGRK